MPFYYEFRLRKLLTLLNAFLFKSVLFFSPLAAAYDYRIVQLEIPKDEHSEYWFGAEYSRENTFQLPRQAEKHLEPALEIYTHNGWFFSTFSGVGKNFATQKEWQYGIVFAPQTAVKHANKTAQEINFGDRISGGLFANYQALPFLNLLSSIKYGAGKQQNGVKADAALNVNLPLSEQIFFSYLLAGQWTNKAFKQDYYGHSAAINDFGLSNLASIINFEAELTPQWTLDFSLEKTRLLGNSKTGDLIQRDAEFNRYISLEYRFK